MENEKLKEEIKGKEAYYGHIESINSFVEKMRENRDILDAISLSH